MKTKLLFALLLIISCADANAQPLDWFWARSAGGISNEYSNAVCTDASGNVYVTGTFQGSTLTLGSYTLHNAGTGALDIFVAKYDANGNVLWAKSGGGTMNDYVYGICTDRNSNVYVAGYIRDSSITFGTITLNNSDSTGNSTDVFITKYDSLGNEVWCRIAGSSKGWELCWGICTDTENNIFITGMFQSDTSIFGNVTLINKGDYDVFIAKYDVNGNVLWAKNPGGADWDAGVSVCSDANNNIYVTGNFERSAIFGNDTIPGTNYFNMFVAKYDTYGNNIWAKSALGPIFPHSNGNSIASDANGNLYVTGYFEHSVSFANDTLSNAGQDGIFIAKYDSSGNALWGRSPGGTDNDYGYSISADGSGHVFVTGYFASPFLNFGGIPVLNSNLGYTDIFVAEYDANGNALWAINAGSQANDYGMGICAARSGDVYVTGYVGSYSVDLGNATIINNGSNDMFVAKLSSLVGINELSSNESNFTLSPNPATNQFTITSGFAIKEITICNVLGERVFYSQPNCKLPTVNCQLFPKGIYFVRVATEDFVAVKKLVVE